MAKKLSAKIIEPKGLYSRATAAVVAEANKHYCQLTIVCGDEEADLKSIMNVMALVIREGEEFTIIANGEGEDEAIKKLTKVMKSINLI